MSCSVSAGFHPPSTISCIWLSKTDEYLYACVRMQIFYVNHSANFFLYCMTGQRFRRAMWSLCRCRTSEFDRFSSDPALAYLATRHSSSPALQRRIKNDAMWGSTSAISRLATGQLQNKMVADPIHRKSSPAILLNVQSLRRESIVWISAVRNATLLYLLHYIITELTATVCTLGGLCKMIFATRWTWQLHTHDKAQRT